MFNFFFLPSNEHKTQFKLNFLESDGHHVNQMEDMGFFLERKIWTLIMSKLKFQDSFENISIHILKSIQLVHWNRVGVEAQPLLTISHISFMSTLVCTIVKFHHTEKLFQMLLTSTKMHQKLSHFFI